MKCLKLFLLLAAISFTTGAHATQYVIIQQTFWGQMRFVYVPKPDRLDKWYYDAKADSYFRFKTWIGIPVKIIKPRNCAAIAS